MGFTTERVSSSLQLTKYWEFFQGLMSQAVLELVTAIVKVLAGIVNLFASGGVVEGFFKDLWLLISQIWRHVNATVCKIMGFN